VQLSEGGENALAPQIVIDPQGEAVAVWRRSDGTNTLIQAAVRPPGEPWQAPATLSAPGGSADEAHVAEDSQGNAIAIWERFDGTSWIVQAASRPAAGVWEPAGGLGVGTSDSEARVALDASGNAAAVWSGWDGSENTVRAATDNAASPPEPDLSVPVGTAGQPVTVTASWPLDPWLQLGSASWILGDGSSARGPTVTHTYAEAGEYPLSFEAEDLLGHTLAASATIAIEPAPIEFTAENWSFSASLKPHKVKQAIVTPNASTFNGAAVIHLGSGTGSVRGNVMVPGFHTGKIGLREVTLGVALTQAGAITGQLKRSEVTPGYEVLTIPVQLNLAITSATWAGTTYPLHCASWAPVSLDLTTTITPEQFLAKSWSFAGSTTVPGINCVRPPRGISGPWLTKWLSNSATPFSVTLAAPH